MDMKRQLWRSLVCLTLLAALSAAAPASASAANFKDVPAGHWAEESIRRCAELGFLSGQSAARFGLGGEMSRGTFAQVLCRFYGWETGQPQAGEFEDVPAGHAAAGAVAALLDHGVVTTQRPDFRPDAALTREDLAVMLVRSLGYGPLAGVAQELENHFQDLHTNTGYIAMAYNLGLTNGTSATTFSPERAVTREEVAVTLIRLYDKLHASAPEITAILEDPEGETLPDMTGLDAAAIPVGRLMGLADKPALSYTMSEETAAALKNAAKAAGAKAFLLITGGPSALDAPPEEAAALLAETVRSGGYDGLMLDMPELKRERQRSLSAFVRRLRAALGEDTPLYLVAEAPAWNGKAYGGYDYAALSGSVDKLILRLSAYPETRSGVFPVAPVDPLDELYYALVSMKGHVELSRLAILLDTTPAVWNYSARRLELKREELQTILAGAGTPQYSQRYGCAYLEGVNGKEDVGVWMLDERALLTRRQMIQAFGVGALCFSDWRDVPPGLLAAWR